MIFIHWIKDARATSGSSYLDRNEYEKQKMTNLSILWRIQ